MPIVKENNRKTSLINKKYLHSMKLQNIYNYLIISHLIISDSNKIDEVN